MAYSWRVKKNLKHNEIRYFNFYSKYLFLLVILSFLSCFHQKSVLSTVGENPLLPKSIAATSLIVLGTVQDAGSPHLGCKKSCCRSLFEHPDPSRKVVSLGLVDGSNQATYLFEATPDFPQQAKALHQYSASIDNELPNAIFLTHAHIGHYTGLMYLGKEGMGTKDVPIFAMPKMKTFLESNGPWSQLVTSNNISITEIRNKENVVLSKSVSVHPFLVPHRDEFSETVGYIISGPNKRALFIPDIDKWQKWDQNIIDEIAQVDYAFIDATFYDAAEINYRDISEIPHPFIIETMDLLKDLSVKEKNKIYFIHLNHTNPALNPESMASKTILANGFHVARVFDVFAL